jgi:pimeloyl-ACP methyl ester carboxylesterase
VELFSFISSNERGDPLRDYETIVHLIAPTTTAKGLPVTCRLDRREYATGRRISDEEIQSITLSCLLVDSLRAQGWCMAAARLRCSPLPKGGTMNLDRLLRTIAILVALLLVSGGVLHAPVAWASGPFLVISTTETEFGNLDYLEMVVQNGANPLDRFKVHRLKKGNVPAHALKQPIILMPSLANTFESYIVGTAPGGADIEHSTAGNLAGQNFDVWGYSSRETLLAPGSCAPNGPVDCSIMSTWGIQAQLDDIEFIRPLIAAVHGPRKPAIGGLSLGALTGQAAINQDPQEYAGLLLFEESLYVADPGLRANYQIVCNGLNAQIAGGGVFTEQFGAGTKALLQLSQIAPNAPTPFPGFPPGTTNRQAYVLVLTAPAPGPPASPFNAGFRLVAGSVAEDRFFFASEDILASTIRRFNHYVAVAELRDVVCSQAGDATFTGNLGAFQGSVLAIQAGLGFGALLQDVFPLMPNADIALIQSSDFGHVDFQVNADHQHLLDKPIAQWLKHDVGQD